MSMPAEGTCLYFCVGLFIGIFVLCTLVFTPTALFTNHWALETRTESDQYSWYPDYTTTTTWNGVDGAASVCVYIAFVFTLLPFKWACCMPCCSDDCCSAFLGLIMICYSISAICSFIGCLIHAGQFATSQLGYSFYLCLTPGLLFLLLIVFAIIIIMCFAEDLCWKCKQCCESDCTCCKVNVTINPSHSENTQQSAEPASENFGQVSGDVRNDGHVFTVTPSYSQVSGQPPAYNEVPGFKKIIKKPKV